MKCCYAASNALAIALSAFAAILAFWAVVLFMVLSGRGIPRPAELRISENASSGSTLTPLASAFIGAALGALAAHYFTSRRDMRTRAGAFVGYLLQWRTSIERKNPKNLGDVFAAYEAGLTIYRLELGKVRKDFVNCQAFMTKSNDLGRFHEHHFSEYPEDFRNPACTLIDDLTDLVEGRDRHAK